MQTGGEGKYKPFNIPVMDRVKIAKDIDMGGGLLILFMIFRTSSRTTSIRKSF